MHGDVVKRNRHKKVLNHNYLPLLTQGTPSFIKKETAHKCAGKPPPHRKRSPPPGEENSTEREGIEFKIQGFGPIPVRGWNLGR